MWNRSGISCSLTALLAALWFMAVPSRIRAESAPLLVFYGPSAPLEALLPFDLLVFDGAAHPPIESLTERDKTTLGYLSLGEVKNHHPYFKALERERLLLEENVNGKASFFIDLRDRRWTQRVIEELVPRLIRKGFDGIFLDTLDTPPFLEKREPEKFKGMREAAINLVKTIRLHYPQQKIMMNRGYALLPEVGPHIDMLMAESLRSSHDFANNRYYRVDEAQYRTMVDVLQKTAKRFVNLKIYTMDYWDTDDGPGVAAIYREERANGFLPYVSTIKLDQITPPPQEQ
ncbi:MAG: hypothetical protein HW380_1871 [Magnetococcales bacterium]|nr:hypothetical protein [Magnetococcales bacterium]